jgi:hypothetical protein
MRKEGGTYLQILATGEKERISRWIPSRLTKRRGDSFLGEHISSRSRGMVETLRKDEWFRSDW